MGGADASTTRCRSIGACPGTVEIVGAQRPGGIVTRGALTTLDVSNVHLSVDELGRQSGLRITMADDFKGTVGTSGRLPSH